MSEYSQQNRRPFIPDDELGPVEPPDYFDEAVREAELGNANSSRYMEDPRRAHGPHRQTFLDHPLPDRPADYRNRWSPPPYRPGRFIETPWGVAQRDALGRLVYPEQRGPHAGKGPRTYNRSDERIAEDVNEILTDRGDVDASDVEVRVVHGEVTLMGTVDDRRQKHSAEDAAWQVSGVRDVRNELRVEPRFGKSRERAA